MPTFPQILPAVMTGLPEKEGGAAGFSKEQTGVPGLFQELIARALSPASNENISSAQPDQRPQKSGPTGVGLNAPADEMPESAEPLTNFPETFSQRFADSAINALPLTSGSGRIIFRPPETSSDRSGPGVSGTNISGNSQPIQSSAGARPLALPAGSRAVRHTAEQTTDKAGEKSANAGEPSQTQSETSFLNVSVEALANDPQAAAIAPANPVVSPPSEVPPAAAATGSPGATAFATLGITSGLPRSRSFLRDQEAVVGNSQTGRSVGSPSSQASPPAELELPANGLKLQAMAAVQDGKADPVLQVETLPQPANAAQASQTAAAAAPARVSPNSKSPDDPNMVQTAGAPFSSFQWERAEVSENQSVENHALVQAEVGENVIVKGQESAAQNSTHAFAHSPAPMNASVAVSATQTPPASLSFTGQMASPVMVQNAALEKSAALATHPPVAGPVKPEMAFVSKNQPAEATSSSTRAEAGSAPPLPPDSNGTSIAKQGMAMKQAEKTNKIAGQTEKVLPGNAISSTRINSPPLISGSGVQVTATVVASSVTGTNINAAAPLPADSAGGLAVAGLHDRILDRVQDMVAVNSMRLGDSGNNSMQVVIKPDGGTQLSLELRQHNGGVQIQAVLQQGDFNHLNQQWPDLQHRLDQRGIRLAPLTDTALSGNGGSNEGFQQKQSPGASPIPDLPSLPVSAASSASMSAQTQRQTYHGWETWA